MPKCIICEIETNNVVWGKSVCLNCEKQFKNPFDDDVYK